MGGASGCSLARFRDSDVVRLGVFLSGRSEPPSASKRALFKELFSPHFVPFMLSLNCPPFLPTAKRLEFSGTEVP